MFTGFCLGGACVNKRLGADPESDFLSGIHEEVVVVPVLQRILPDPDGLVVVIPGGVLKTLRRNEDVVKELEADVDALLAAALDLAHQDLLQLRPEDQHPELDPGVRGPVT